MLCKALNHHLPIYQDSVSIEDTIFCIHRNQRDWETHNVPFIPYFISNPTTQLAPDDLIFLCCRVYVFQQYCAPSSVNCVFAFWDWKPFLWLEIFFCVSHNTSGGWGLGAKLIKVNVQDFWPSTDGFLQSQACEQTECCSKTWSNVRKHYLNWLLQHQPKDIIWISISDIKPSSFMNLKHGLALKVLAGL